MLAGYTQALRGSHPNVRLQFSITALLGIAIDGGIYAIIFNLFILRLGYGPEFVGLVNSVANLVFAAGSLLAGWLGMQWGQRRTMIAGLAVLSVGAMAVPLATVVPAAARGGWIMVSFVVAYSGLALYYVNSGPFLLRVTSAANRGNIFALQSAISSIASFTGSIIGGLLPGFVALLLGLSMTQPGPYQAPLFLVAGLTVVSLLVLLRTREPAPAAELEGREEPRAGGAPSMMTAYGLIAFMAVVRFLQVAGVGEQHDVLQCLYG
ncbi:MAG: MFS transporter [Anaerolineales bacterium]|nr:MFS transporter [Anaerolineales bacterium]